MLPCPNLFLKKSTVAIKKYFPRSTKHSLVLLNEISFKIHISVNDETHLNALLYKFDFFFKLQNTYLM